MAERRVAFVVAGETVIVVDGEIPDDADQPITIIMDTTWRLQRGAPAPAYAILHQQTADYLRENEIPVAVIKASATSGRGGATKGLLSSAEARGVVIAASATVSEVRLLAKAVVSRTYGGRNVDDYVADDDFWRTHTRGGELRTMSREAAMYLIASRNV